MTKILLVIGGAALLAACDAPARRSPNAPTLVVPVATNPPAPPPAPVFLEPYTELIVGGTIQRTVLESSNPQCPEHYLGLGCQYFRITPDRDGMLEIEVTWVVATQPGQGLDLTHQSSLGSVWADIGRGNTVRVTSRVRAGETSQIVVWYTRPGLEFTLQTALQPS